MYGGAYEKKKNKKITYIDSIYNNVIVYRSFINIFE